MTRGLVLVTMLLVASCAGRRHDRAAIHASAEAKRALIYPSCAGAPKGNACGLVSRRFFAASSLQRFADERCDGVSAEACRAAMAAEWVDAIAARYYLAHTADVTRYCVKRPGPCRDPAFVELAFMKSHNRGVQRRLQARRHRIQQEGRENAAATRQALARRRRARHSRTPSSQRHRTAPSPPSATGRT